jgi:hypothetical protein
LGEEFYRKGWVFVVGALGCFDVDEAKPAIVVGCAEVHGFLVVGDIEAFDGVALLEMRCRKSSGEESCDWDRVEHDGWNKYASVGFFS